MKKLIIIFLLSLGLALSLSSQAPFAFNYQGVASDASGNAIANQEISLRISIVRSFAQGTTVFSEEHFVNTNEGGVFSLRIGEGDPVLGNLRAIEWGDDLYYVRTEMDTNGGSNYEDLGTAQLYSVPYALYAANSGSSSSGGGSSSDDQQLSFSGTTLSIENGNSVSLSTLRDGVTDADADPNNELQQLSISGSRLSISGGNTIDLPSGGGNGGSNTDNQALSLAGKVLSISGGNSVDLSGVSNDADSDPTNEHQVLSFSGNTLSISSGNSVSLPTGTVDTDDQILSLNGSTLSISDGNSVELPTSTGGGSTPWTVFDNSISYSGDFISYTNDDGDIAFSLSAFSNGAGFLNMSGSDQYGNVGISGFTGIQSTSVNNNLTSYTGEFDGEGFMNVYKEGLLLGGLSSAGSRGGQLELYSVAGNRTLRARTESGQEAGELALLHEGTVNTLLQASADGSGRIEVYHPSSQEEVAVITTSTNQAGLMEVSDNQGRRMSLIGVGTDDTGYIGTYADNGQDLIAMTALSSETGFVNVYGGNGNSNIALTRPSGQADRGFISVRDDNGDTKTAALVTSNNLGRVFTRGPNGNTNVNISASSLNNNNGYVSVHDSGGDEEAGIYVDENGQGRVFADVKNFKMTHPKNAEMDIVYASIEGPEAAAYCRGTYTLINGEATIPYPDHYGHVASQKTVTIMITPLSAESKGLAIIEKTKEGFKVKELLGGTGNYNFDWEAKAIRNGFEDYKVIMKKSSFKSNQIGNDEEKDPIGVNKPTARQASQNNN